MSTKDTYKEPEEDYHWYLLFSPDTPEDEARQRFIERFGVEPKRVVRVRPMPYWAVGPVPDDQTKRQTL